MPMPTIPLKIKKLHPDAIIPHYAQPNDAGLDLRSLQQHIIEPNESAEIATGLAIELPPGYVALVWDKSSLAFKHNLKTMGGVIDSGYRGEIKLKIINLGQQAYTVNKGDKVVNLLIQRVERAEILEVNDLSQSDRGEGGFGSTGV